MWFEQLSLVRFQYQETWCEVPNGLSYCANILLTNETHGIILHLFQSCPKSPSPHIIRAETRDFRPNDVTTELAGLIIPDSTNISTEHIFTTDIQTRLIKDCRLRVNFLARGEDVSHKRTRIYYLIFSSSRRFDVGENTNFQLLKIISREANFPAFSYSRSSMLPSTTLFPIVPF